MALSAERRAALLSTKLAALVRPVAGGRPFVPGVFGAGAAGVAGAAWVLLDDRPAHGLGAALAWAEREAVTAVNVLAESGSGVLARRAAYFADAPTVWSVDGRDLAPASAEAFPPPIDAPPDLDSWRARIEEGGATPVLEHGVLSGEVLGLEVCRVTVDPDTGDHRLVVGVGAPHHREAFLLIHGGSPPPGALADVVQKVDALRRAAEPPHALRRLAGERLLRQRLLDDPSLVGAVALEAAPPPVPRANVKDPVPCVATGIDRSGLPLVVVCSVGIDLDVVPFAADARAALGDPDARLAIVVPARDAHVVTRRLAERLVVPAQVVPLTP